MGIFIFILQMRKQRDYSYKQELINNLFKDTHLFSGRVRIQTLGIATSNISYILNEMIKQYVKNI